MDIRIQSYIPIQPVNAVRNAGQYATGRTAASSATPSSQPTAANPYAANNQANTASIPSATIYTRQANTVQQGLASPGQTLNITV